MNSNKRINKNLLVISEYINELELDNCRLRNSDEILNNVIEEKDKEIERLNNIIKEVREFIEKYSIMYKHEIEPYKVVESEELLKILDKGE